MHCLELNGCYWGKASTNASQIILVFKLSNSLRLSPSLSACCWLKVLPGAEVHWFWSVVALWRWEFSICWCSNFYLKVTVFIKGLLLWAVLTVASGRFMTGHQKKQLLFTCRIPVGLTLVHSVLIGRGKKVPRHSWWSLKWECLECIKFQWAFNNPKSLCFHV